MKLITLRVSPRQHDAIKKMAFDSNRTIPQHVLYVLGVHAASPLMLQSAVESKQDSVKVQRSATVAPQPPFVVDPDIDGIDFED